uniref:Uncharacterized protein n=1 Tax=Arion vulgaris TaxID=1028688 RepID=A0A0B7B3T0_9EUPU
MMTACCVGWITKTLQGDKTNHAGTGEQLPILDKLEGKTSYTGNTHDFLVFTTNYLTD